MKTLYAVLIALVLPLSAADTSWAGGCDCGAEAACGCEATASCGCDNGSNGCCGPCKVCKLVRVERIIKTTSYGVKCKDICIPGCGSGCTKVKCVKCGDAGCCDCCNSNACGKVCVATGKPGCCARSKTVKQLVKYEKAVKVCAYEWVVVDAGSGGCDAGCGAAVSCGCDR
jgi:hypothetical protein